MLATGQAENDMRYELSGTTMQTVSIDLDAGERLYS